MDAIQQKLNEVDSDIQQLLKEISALAKTGDMAEVAEAINTKSRLVAQLRRRRIERDALKRAQQRGGPPACAICEVPLPTDTFLQNPSERFCRHCKKDMQIVTSISHIGEDAAVGKLHFARSLGYQPHVYRDVVCVVGHYENGTYKETAPTVFRRLQEVEREVLGLAFRSSVVLGLITFIGDERHFDEGMDIHPKLILLRRKITESTFG